MLPLRSLKPTNLPAENVPPRWEGTYYHGETLGMLLIRLKGHFKAIDTICFAKSSPQAIRNQNKAFSHKRTGMNNLRDD